MQYLSRYEVEREYGRISFVANDLSPAVREGVHPTRKGGIPDYVNMLNAGWETLFSSMRKHQPKVFDAISDCNPRLLVGERFRQHRIDASRIQWNADAFLEINDRYFVIHPYHRSMTKSPGDGRSPFCSRYLSLPRGISEAYYARMEGMEVAFQLPLNSIESRVLPAKISAWKDIRTGLGIRKESHNKIAKSLSSYLAQTEEDFDLSDFKVFLDTREQGDFSQHGSVLLVNQRLEGGSVFHLRLEGPEKIEVVPDLVCLMDDYVSWVIKGARGDFDFYKYM